MSPNRKDPSYCPWTRSIERVKASLGSEFKVESSDAKSSTGCDLILSWKDCFRPDSLDYIGSVTFCLKQRKWCAGISVHAHRFMRQEDWYGMNGEIPHSGRQWIEKTVCDIRTAVSRSLLDCMDAYRSPEKVPEWVYEAAGDEWRWDRGIPRKVRSTP